MMTEISNSWLAFENSLALAMWDWYKWARDGYVGPEPPLANPDKKVVLGLTDQEFAFKCFKKASGGGKEWRLVSAWHTEKAEIDALYQRHGDANAGGDFEAAGLWYYTPTRSIEGHLCRRDETYGWQPTQLVKFMPDVCISRNPDGSCAQWSAATELTDVVLLIGQPLRDFA